MRQLGWVTLLAFNLACSGGLKTAPQNNSTNNRNGNTTGSTVGSSTGSTTGTTTGSTTGGTTGSTTGSGTISSQYRGDQDIGSDSRVLFYEDFEESTIANMASRWESVRNQEGMTFLTDTRAPNSAGTKSLRVTNVGGVNDGGGLYRRINGNTGYDQVYFRYYVRYPTGGSYSHSGASLGGYNPPTAWPQGTAGIRPNGSDRFTVSFEPMGPYFDFYSYWMGMHGNPNSNPSAGTNYWGNSFLGNPNLVHVRNEWVCVEYMVRMNPNLSAPDGELRLWINDTEQARFTQGSPSGTWLWDNFYMNPYFDPEYMSGPGNTPFEGFQWRNNANLRVNFVSLGHYVTGDPNGYQGSVMFDQVVLATSRIGCIQP